METAMSVASCHGCIRLWYHETAKKQIDETSLNALVMNFIFFESIII